MNPMMNSMIKIQMQIHILQKCLKIQTILDNEPKEF